jgi:hypothetical protein
MPWSGLHAAFESDRSVLYHSLGEDQPMPDDNDDQHIVLNFQPGPRSRRANGQKGPTHLKTDPEDIIASGAVVVALIFAVAMVSGWVPVGRYTIGIVACLAALAVAVKLIKARRSKASVTDLPRQRR